MGVDVVVGVDGALTRGTVARLCWFVKVREVGATICGWDCGTICDTCGT